MSFKGFTRRYFRSMSSGANVLRGDNLIPGNEDGIVPLEKVPVRKSPLDGGLSLRYHVFIIDNTAQTHCGHGEGELFVVAVVGKFAVRGDDLYGVLLEGNDLPLRGDGPGVDKGYGLRARVIANLAIGIMLTPFADNLKNHMGSSMTSPITEDLLDSFIQKGDGVGIRI